uniref:Uncharacterized protein n=1 Tax=mine drainage metagenome TaxID=410659 RepID=E6QVP9_9ZZZZ
MWVKYEEIQPHLITLTIECPKMSHESPKNLHHYL